MKIVVLDGYTLNPGDLSWEGLEALGDLSVYEHFAINLILIIQPLNLNTIWIQVVKKMIKIVRKKLQINKNFPDTLYLQVF